MATFPGLHPTVDLEDRGFSLEERKIVYGFSESCMYVTTCGDVRVGNATYRYVSVRPADNIEFALPNALEFIVLFSPYKTFEVRTLQAFAMAEEQFDSIRLNRHFKFLISEDPNIVDKMRNTFQENSDIPVVIPFTYDGLHGSDVRSRVLTRVRESFYFRDLFAQRDPLREATFFFGRSETLARLRDRMGRSENSGFFGLRKSGKTSVLLAAQRFAKADGHLFIPIDCQSSGVTTLRWNELLKSIARQLRSAAGMAAKDLQLGDFSPQNAAASFERNLKEVSGTSRKRLVLAFDEVEQISSETGVGAWRSEMDPVYLWQTIRSLHQKLDRKFSFLVTGTNPTIAEARQMCGVDNPMLAYLDSEYLGGLSEAEAELMCRTLGGLMGLEFGSSALAALYSSLGGHAYLTRQVCSFIHKSRDIATRPINVGEEEVSTAVLQYDFTSLLDDIMASLKLRFADELTLLEWIALGDQEQVGALITADPGYARHLLGYGLIKIYAGQARPRMRIVTDYLRRSAAQSGLVKDRYDRWALIAKRRGELEVGLRRLVRNYMIDRHGRVDGANALRNCLNKERAKALEGAALDDIFAEQGGRLYWSDLMCVITKDRAYWSRRLEVDEDQLISVMNYINKHRSDAHADLIADDEFDRLLSYLDSLQEAI